ncbi:MAG: UDP-N-acetylglucosamine 1-carboxyvinyltransferase [Candidatus Acetothermia bacterium]|jgi:UDP-N-acetylglucosamine 1-carboxyvinyltransferase|nr:UDP-N-acetylglucosamine 1-carboxyvinyltransferase [Candidatus Acetothermia bacterium]MDH7505181.1 UDP-N-acetylglucosamine 1-carboxyvinyltransferase [Candidatus Acetothermia bacterium]
MRQLIIRGGQRLSGALEVEGAKNAALPILCATILTDAEVILRNVPHLQDVVTIVELLKALGKRVEQPERNVYRITAQGRLRAEVPAELVRRMRASFLVLGPLLARLGEARVSLPGGCVLGPRPVDLHLKGLAQIGAEIGLVQGGVEARGRLHGAEIYLDYPSVGATEQLLLAAAAIPERTVIRNPAFEPEVEDLAHFLEAMGARITWGREIEVHGAERLHGADYRIIPDRINAGTYMIGVALAGGRARIGCRPAHLEALLRKLRECGARIEEEENAISIESSGELQPLELETGPYPGFPTDLQPQMTALLSVARGTSIVRERVFPDRFAYVPQLVRMGAQIRVSDSTAIIKGVAHLEGAAVQATDIRAGAALVLAGLAAQAETVVLDEGHLARGYSDIARDLRALGTKIRWEDQD